MYFLSTKDMDPKFINSRSGMRTGDCVFVSEKYGEPTRNEGTVDYIEMAPINRAGPHGDQAEHIYVRFNDSSVYRRWLKRGSPVMVNMEKHIILEIDENNDSLSVAKDGGVYMINPIRKTVSFTSIDSMLIWRAGYILE
jgi:hypothetical protein